MVVIKFIAPNIEDIPARCKAKIARSTDTLLCAEILANGGITTHDVPAPPSTKVLSTINRRDGTSNHNEILLSRGKLISTAPIIIGTRKLPKQPSVRGITK